MNDVYRRDFMTDPVDYHSETEHVPYHEPEGTYIQHLEEQIAALKAKLVEQRSYLRAANRGAERNHTALQLAIARYHNTINSDKRWNERDERDHQTLVWNWLLLSDEEISKKLGYMADTASCRALLKAMLGSRIQRV